MTSNYFAFNGVSGYGSSDTLQPGRAYWVKASTAGTIVLDVRNTPATVPVVPGDEDGPIAAGMDAITFTVPGTEGQAATLYIAGAENPKVGSGLFELPPAPPAGAFDIRFSSNRFAEALAKGSGKELPIMVQGVTGEIRVTASLSGNGSGALALVEKTGTTVTATHTLTDGKSVTLSVGEGKRYSIAEVGLPLAYALDQNYPNPFNPTTTIRFSLPVDGVVSLTVYNVLGEAVATPISREATAAGYHAVEFNASALPTGAYFYNFRVQGTDGQTFTRNMKMLLVK